MWYARFRQWWGENVWYVSWGKRWKGIYLHFIPFFRVRLFLWGMDWRRRNGWGQTLRRTIRRMDREDRRKSNASQP